MLAAKNKKKTLAVVISATAAAVLTLSIVLICLFFPRGTKAPAVTFLPKPLSVSTQDGYALQTYGYDELGEVQTTLRADTMYVTRRNLARTQPVMMSDTYTVTSKSPDYSNSIAFTKYPSPTTPISANDFAEAATTEAEKHGIDTFSAEGLAEAKTKYFAYYKYMLLSQSRSMLKDVSARSAAGTLQGNLYKHPSADLQYGEVEGSDNAVEKVIFMDPAYRSYHATGLYLPAGEYVTVKVEGLKNGEKISVSVALQDSMGWRGNASGEQAKAAIAAAGQTYEGEYFADADKIAASGRFYDVFESTDDGIATPLLSSQWARQNSRMPMYAVSFTFTENKEYVIGSPMGGIMHLSPDNCYSAVKTTFTGAVETPHYILGITTPEYFEEYLVDAPGVMAVLDTENGQLVGAARYMRTVAADEIDKLAMLWHSFFALNETYTGGTHDRRNVVKFDTHVPAGAAVALGGMVYACPTGWYGSAMNYRQLLERGSWGILHEIGHSHGSAYGTVWGFAGNMEGEVRNNALIALCYLKFCDIGTTRNDSGAISAEHGFVAHPYSNLKHTLGLRSMSDFNECGYFDALSMYVNIMHTFGTDKFFELLKTYSASPSLTEDGTDGNKRSDFAYRCAKVYGMDFRKYFNDFYAANITDSMFGERQLEEMSQLPVYEPIANLYAGTIDGAHTGGDYKVTFGSDVELRLAEKTVTCGKSFEIVSVEQPVHGRITDEGDGVYRYRFDENYYGESDGFRFSVRQDNGQTHVFTVTLRISYNGSTQRHYGAVAAKDVDALENEIASLEPTVTSGGVAGAANFTNAQSGVNEGVVSSFYYRAEKDGETTFSLKCDDKARVYVGDSFDDAALRLQVNSYATGYSPDRSFSMNLTKGKLYAVKIVLLNTGGQGMSRLGKQGSNGNFADIGAGTIYPSSMTGDVLNRIKNAVFEPEFMVSDKVKVDLGSLSSPKSDWAVVSAPENIQNGRYLTEDLTDEDGNKIGEMVTDKRNWLIDGQNGTVFHTVWRGAGIKPPSDDSPDVFVIDTNRLQNFNYFTVTSRGTADSKIKKYKLEVSDDNINYREVSSGDELEYSGNAAKLRFAQVRGRFWRLSVYSTTGGNFTIIAELDAGTASETQKIVPSTSAMLYKGKRWAVSDGSDGLPAGFMTVRRKNQKMVMRFVGDSIALYAAKGDGYGSARVKIDGKDAGEIDLSGDELKLKQLVFHCEGLEQKEHTVEIITNTNNFFNLNFAGLPYSAQLVNAPNIYAERALSIALTVFVILFALTLAFVLLLFFVPSLRGFVFRDKTSKTDKLPKSRKDKSGEKADNPDKTLKAGKDKASAGDKANGDKKSGKAGADKKAPRKKATDTDAKDDKTATLTRLRKKGGDGVEEVILPPVTAAPPQKRTTKTDNKKKL